jgi:hypothetical protein
LAGSVVFHIAATRVSGPRGLLPIKIRRDPLGATSAPLTRRADRRFWQLLVRWGFRDRRRWQPQCRDQVLFFDRGHRPDTPTTRRGELGVPGQVQKRRSVSTQRAVSSGTGRHAGRLIAIRFGVLGELAIRVYKTRTWTRLRRRKGFPVPAGNVPADGDSST